MEMAVRALFERYERFFNTSIDGRANLDEVVSVYAAEFIGASPAGVRTGKNDDGFKSALEQGFAHYRAIGTKEMRVENIRLTAIDDGHCLAQVAWTSVYRRNGRLDATIPFDVHYFIQMSGGGPKIFGWVTGDEQALLNKHGVG